MGAKAIKLGSWDKHPAYCYDWNVNVWYMRNGNNAVQKIPRITQMPSGVLFAPKRLTSAISGLDHHDKGF